MLRIIFILLSFVLLNFNGLIVKSNNSSKNFDKYINVDSLFVDSINYVFSWSLHPNQLYYKNEFLNRGDSVTHFKKMISIEFLVGNYALIDVVNQKRVELERRKTTDKFCNQILYENNEKGEYMLDFLISEQDSNSLIVERNIYRYKLYSDSINKGVLLFAYSERSYDNEIMNFLKNMKSNNFKMVNKIGNYDLSSIKLIAK